MKKFYIFFFLLLSLVFGSEYISPIWKATGENFSLNFNSSYSDVTINLTDFKENVCWLWKSGYQISGYVDTETVWYVYFSEPDGDDSVDSCVWIVLSWTEWYMIWTGAMEVDKGATMYFDNIKLIWDNGKKEYYFDWESISNVLWKVKNWNNVWISWLNLIDWSKTVIDITDCSGWTKYANGQSCDIKIILKDVWWNPVKIISFITWQLINIPSSYDNKVFLSTWWENKVKFKVDNGILTIPLYFLKPVQNGSVSVKLFYSIPDIDGNISHQIDITNINIKNPLKDVKLKLLTDPIIWENVEYEILQSFYDTWLINTSSVKLSSNIKFTGDWADKYIFKNGENVDWHNGSFLVWPVDINYNQSVLNLILSWWRLIVDFGSYFNGATWEYNFSGEYDFRLYADKRVDWTKSEIQKIDYMWNIYKVADSNNSPIFKVILRNYTWLVIPDVKFNISFKDNWIANSYSWWDCNEINDLYQTNCKSIVFFYSGNYYNSIIDWRQWASFSYQTNGYIYTGIKIISFKPITWDSQIKVSITWLQNISTQWANFENSWSYLSMIDTWFVIKNLHFKPALNLRLKWLDDDLNYIDVNNEIYLLFENVSNYNFKNILYHLTGNVDEPSDWSVKFSTWYWDILTGDITLLTWWAEKYLPQTILFVLDYAYDSRIVIDYNSWYYSYSIDFTPIWNIWQLTLIPWSFWFNLWATYKFGGVFVAWLLNKAEKWSASVKTVIWKKLNWWNNMINITFANIYNMLKKKASFLVRWKKPDGEDVDIEIKPNNDLKWWLKYYKCTPGAASYIIISTGQYEWWNTILIENCRVIIRWNIYKTNTGDYLVIFAWSSEDSDNPRDNSNRINTDSTIYITENVSDIEAALLTRWSILTVDWQDISKIIVSNRIYNINEKQLYIHWALMWRNTIWWSFLVKDSNTDEKYFVIWWGYKIYETDTFWWKTDLKDIRDAVQIFDANFWRWYKYSWPNTIDSNWYSNYCKSFGVDKPKQCKYPVIVEYDSVIRKSMLFR